LPGTWHAPSSTSEGGKSWRCTSPLMGLV
jgi:hypothetical protein